MNTYKIIQSNSDSMGQVSAYCDSFIFYNRAIVFFSFYGTTVSVKSIVAQIITNRGGLFLEDTEGVLFQIDNYSVELKRNFEKLRIITKNIKPGITQKVLYSEDLFFPSKKEEQTDVLIFGKTKEDAIPRFFGLLDQMTTIPLKKTWNYWLWEKLEDQLKEPVVNTSCAEFDYCRVIKMPSDEWLKDSISEDLEYLREL